MDDIWIFVRFSDLGIPMGGHFEGYFGTHFVVAPKVRVTGKHKGSS